MNRLYKMVMTRLRSGAGTRRDYVAMAGKRRAPRRAAGPRLSKPAAKAVKKIVKKTISRRSETKFVSAKYDTTHNSTIGSADPTALCPLVTQGTDDFQRIGDRIQGKYLIVKGKVQWDSSYLLSNGTTTMPPVTCRILILSQNNIRNNGQIPSEVQYNYILKDNVGVGTGRAYGGGPWDNLAPINKDLFKVHFDKKVKLNWVHPVNSSTAVDQAAVGNDRTKYFYCRIPVKKVLKFDDSMPTPNAPSNFAPFFCFGAVSDDGESPYTTGTPFRISWLSTLYYTDA